jgi:CheY-like chemotaxis protein
MSAQPSILPLPPRRLILVADDDPLIQAFVARVVTRIGLVPLLAANGLIALEQGQAHISELAGAVLDVMMPGKSGIEVAVQLHGLDPQLPIALMSGYASPPLEVLIVQFPTIGILMKPFQVNELREILQYMVIVWL